MAMELYNYWVKVGSPTTCLLRLHYYCVNFHSFRPHDRSQVLWELLRPQRAEKSTLLENDDGKNFK
jgi:cbb3-type cytochrome oxidase subunit 3